MKKKNSEEASLNSSSTYIMNSEKVTPTPGSVNIKYQ